MTESEIDLSDMFGEHAVGHIEGDRVTVVLYARYDGDCIVQCAFDMNIDKISPCLDRIRKVQASAK